jgi:DNA-binding GntR family transcriptional regulator
MPIRDAITRLATEGFVTVSPRKVTQVADFSLQEMHELFTIRAVLEPYAAGLACGVLTESDLQKLTGLVDRMTERLRANDLKGWFRLNQNFHFLVFDRANNTTLRGILVELWDKTLRRRAKVLLNRPGFVAQRMAEHQAIVEAFRMRNVEAAEWLWKEHIARSGDETEAFFATAQDTPSGPSVESILRRTTRRVGTGAG